MRPTRTQSTWVRQLLDVPKGIRTVILVAGLAGVVMVVVGSLESAGGSRVEVDKLLHFGGYFTLALLFVVGLPPRLYLLALAGLLLMGTGIEFLQPLQGRSFDWGDQLANSLGVVLGASVGLFVRWLLARIRTSIAAASERRRTLEVEKGHVLFRQGEPSDDLFVVRRGRVRLYREVAGGVQELETAAEGAVIGELGVIQDEPRYASAEALEPSTLLRIEARQLRHACADENPVAPLVRALAQRLKEADDRLEAARG